VESEGTPLFSRSGLVWFGYCPTGDEMFLLAAKFIIEFEMKKLE
jgi:hypothetical protein